MKINSLKADRKSTSTLYAPIAKLIPAIIPEVRKGLERIHHRAVVEKSNTNS
jgi:hypothetical protein